jgi:hypothetical protein
MLRSFQDVPGWREAFRAAAKRLDEVRTGSLFPHPLFLCGEPVRAFTLRDWVILDHAQNPFVSGGEIQEVHALKVIWLLHKDWSERGAFSDRRQLRMFSRVGKRTTDDLEVINEVNVFIDDAFLDMPGRYSTGRKKGISATKWPRKSFAVDLCAEIMGAFPSFTFEALMQMPLAAFWQWLHAARKIEDPAYRNYQETDAVNARACDELNRLRAEAVSRN